jgi:hypothetical protein
MHNREPASLEKQIHEIRPRLERLIDEGRRLFDATRTGTGQRRIDDSRAWQAECAVLVNELSGGSKAHWVSRAYSQAFLIRTGNATPVAEVPLTEIVDRILAVLERAKSSLGSLTMATQFVGGAVRRFDFVHDSALRPILEASFVESRRALDERHFETAFLTSCSILEAVITDALQAMPQSKLAEHRTPGSHAEGTIADWPFDVRLTIAERAGIINRGCARLPPSARGYRLRSSGSVGRSADQNGEPPISERDARVVGQVLNVVLRDLDPGR